MLQFVIVLHNVESTVDAIPQERCVLIAIILGSPLKYSHRGSFSFLFVFDEFNDDGVVAKIRSLLRHRSKIVRQGVVSSS